MYHFEINGVRVDCDTVAELYAFANFQLEPLKSCAPVTNFEPLHEAIDEHHEQNGNDKPIDGRTLYHQRVARYAKRNGLTHLEARKALAKKG